MHFKKISGSEGFELRLFDIPPHVDLAAYRGLVAPIAIHTDRLADASTRYGGLMGTELMQDFSILCATSDNFDYAIELLARPEVGLLRKGEAEFLKQAKFCESAYMLTDADKNMSESAVIHDQKGKNLGERIWSIGE